MSTSDSELAKVIEYMQAHWPSKVKPEWQVPLAEYPRILKKVVQDLTLDKTTEHNFVRIAGISGAGKTTQLMPAVEAYYEKRNLRPVLVAARLFAPYHPHYKEIEQEYGAENVRKLTDEFSTIMMFMVLKALTAQKYDLILDVTLLDPAVESILVNMLEQNNYHALLLLIAVSPAVTERHLEGRAWRHSRETEAEFIRATAHALKFYADATPDLHAIVWNAFDFDPVYQGAVKNAVEPFTKWSEVDDRTALDPDARRQAKINLLSVI